MSDIDLYYLNNERVIAFQRIEKLEKELATLTNSLQDVRSIAENKITDDEKSAQNAAIRAQSFLTNVEDSINKIQPLLEEIKSVNDDYKNNKQILSTAIKKSKEIEQYFDNISQIAETIKKNQENVQNLQQQAITNLTNIQNTQAKVQEIEAQTNTFSTNISDVNKKSSELYEEIEEVHDAIWGYDDENGKHESGLKEQLETAYEEVKKFFDETKNKLEIIKDEYEQTFLEKKKQIEELLPDALTAGLANGYVEKKIEEEKKILNHQKAFQKSILGLMLISCIPIAINVTLYFGYGYQLDKLLQTFPSSLAFVLPLYFPVLWLAWNANKELKLSKRLIEEYTHKEVVSKTYQGLAEQVKNLDKSDVSYQLKERLLYNLISVNSENPGKLISDYNKPDNPLMDILDRSVALATAFDKIKGIPGLGRLSSYLDRKEAQSTKKVFEKAEEGLTLQEDLIEKN